jgi:hypothetical protein
MNCTAVRNLLSRKIDNELSEFESASLDSHLSNCASCSREYRILSLPNRIAQAIPPLEPSPFFYSRLRTKLEGEVEKAAGWQAILGLAKQVIPALAGITLALLSVFAYVQFSRNQPDFYKFYDRVFVTEDQPHRMLFSDRGITDESVLTAIAERETNPRRSLDMK